MLQSLVVLLTFQAVGDFLIRITGLPLPGPVLGMLLLAAWLRASAFVPADLPRVSSALLDHLGLLFVPAGLAVTTLGVLVAHDGIAIMAALVVSTTVSVALTAVAFGRRRAPATRPGVVS